MLMLLNAAALSFVLHPPFSSPVLHPARVAAPAMVAEPGSMKLKEIKAELDELGFAEWSTCHPARLLGLLRARPGGSGQLGAPRTRPAHWAPSHGLWCSRQPSPRPPIAPPLSLQASRGRACASSARTWCSRSRPRVPDPRLQSLHPRRLTSHPQRSSPPPPPPHRRHRQGGNPKPKPSPDPKPRP